MRKLVALLLVAEVVRAGVVPVNDVVIGATATQYHAQDELGQYAYGYAGGPSAKEEVKTADGITRGGYDYVDAHGIVQSARYVSDPVNGFRVAATNLPVGPAVPDGPEEGVAVAVAEVAPSHVVAPVPAPVVATAPAQVVAAKPIYEDVYNDDSVSVESAVLDNAGVPDARAAYITAVENARLHDALQYEADVAKADFLSRPAGVAAVHEEQVSVAAPVAAVRTVSVPVAAPVAAVAHSPVAVAAPVAAVAHSPVAVAAPVAAFHSAAVPVAAPVATVGHAPVIVGATATQYHAQDELGQYAYGYAGGPSAKEELKTADGITRGGYDYVDAHGIVQSARYVSDDVHGFRVAATNLPVQPPPTYIADSPEVAEAKARLFQAQADHISKL